jgi:hypothetical protein
VTGAEGVLDILENALVDATTATRPHDRGNWRVEGGADLDGDELTVIVAWPWKPMSSS